MSETGKEPPTGDWVSFSANEAADYLGIDPKLLRQKLRDGLIRGRRNGVTWLVEKPDLDAYAAGIDRHSATRPEAVEALEREPPLTTNSSIPPTNYELMAAWSFWYPFTDAARTIPRKPGVYVAREALSRSIIYVGMAAERKGNGMRGRLAIYARGQGATSGMGEGALDRALADPDWVRQRLAEAEEGVPMRAKAMAKAAIERADIQIRWAETEDGPSASKLELDVLRTLEHLPLWNRRR